MTKKKENKNPAKKKASNKKQKPVKKPTDTRKRNYAMPPGSTKRETQMVVHPDLGDVTVKVWITTFGTTTVNKSTRVEAMKWIKQQRATWREKHGDDTRAKKLQDKVLKNINRLKNLRPMCKEMDANHLDAALQSLASIVKGK